MLKLKLQNERIFLKYINVVFIALVFLLHIITSLLMQSVENPDNILYENEYNHYLNTLKGELTSEKEQFIIHENETLNDANIELQGAYTAYYDGTIDQKTHNEIAEKCNAILANEKGFHLLYEQYLFVREHPNNRYFLNTNAFSALFHSCENVWFIGVYIILIAVPMFCKEYESNMSKLLITYPNGGRFLAQRKVWFTIGMVSLFVILDAILRYIFFTLVYNGTNSDYPLQSLQMFAGFTHNVTILQGYMIACLIRLFGSFLFALFLLCISLFLKQSVSVALVGIIAFFIPLFLTVPTERYLYIVPFSFMVGTGYLMGDIVTTNILTGEEQILFVQPSIETLLLWLLFLICCMLIMYRVILHFNTNLFHMKNRRMIQLGMCLLLTIFISGCSAKEEYKSVYNSIQSQEVQDERFMYRLDNNNMLLAESKENGEIQIVNPLFSHDIEILNYYTDGQYLYYSYLQTEQISLNHMLNESIFRIVGYDSATSQEFIVYEETDHKKTLLNRTKDVSIENQPFFLTNKYLFFYANHTILQVDRCTFAVKEVDVNTSSFAFDGNDIYYIGDNLVLYQYNVRTFETLQLKNVVATSFYLMDETILFINRSDGCKLYTADKNGEHISLLIDDVMDYFYVDEMKIGVMSDSNQMYLIDL